MNQHLHCCYYHSDHSTAYHSDVGSSWQYIIHVRDFVNIISPHIVVIHFEPNPPQKKSHDPHRAFPILPPSVPISHPTKTVFPIWPCESVFIVHCTFLLVHQLLDFLSCYFYLSKGHKGSKLKYVIKNDEDIKADKMSLSSSTRFIPCCFLRS